MENYIAIISGIIKALTLSLGNLFFLLPAFLEGILLLAVLISAVFKKFRYADKKLFLSFTLSFAFSYLAVFINAYETPSYRLFLTLLEFSLCFFTCGVLIWQSELKIKLTNREKRLIGRLYQVGGKSCGGNVRRIEYLSEPFAEETTPEPNLNEIASLIKKLRREDLSTFEEDELDKTETDIQKFAVRPPSAYERKIFSERLLKILKMTSKYNLAE